MESYVITKYVINRRADGEKESTDKTSEYKEKLQGICSLPVKKGLEAICCALGFKYDYNNISHITRRASEGVTMVSLYYERDNVGYNIHVSVQKVITTAPAVYELDNLLRCCLRVR